MKLTNLDISTNHRSREYWLFAKDFTAALSYWIVQQSPYPVPEMSDALCAFDEYISEYFADNLLKKFTYREVEEIINEDRFETIPAIEIYNHRRNGREGMGFCSRYDQPAPDDDFIDLGALARNVFYMILREQIKND